LKYKDRTGTIYLNDSLKSAFRTNTGNSEHNGVETYIEMNILDGLFATKRFGKLSVYNSYAYIDAKYTSGEFKDKQIEYAPKNIERIGLNYKLYGFSMNVQYSYTSSSFADASNALFSSDALSGKIPSYQLIDVSSSYSIQKSLQFKLGVNNLLNENYFTLRTTEYPGPGMIPSLGRTFYCGISARF
jgi:Fe(3+) dicitrate transport protein